MKQIPLTQGQFALVDDEDFEYLNQFKWSARKSKNTYYALRNSCGKNNKKRFIVFMHRVVLELNDLEIKGDHIDGNGLNNQRYNLRPSTNSENARNAKPSNNKSSKYKGVSLKKEHSSKKWCARIKFNGKQIHIGYFECEIHAALAYDKKAKELFGEFAYLNFK